MHSEYAHFQTPSPATEQRVEDLLARLTLEEKIDLLGGITGSDDGNTLGIARAGVPALKMADGPVGVHWWCKSSTAYPACIGLASSWNRDLARRMGVAIGRDGRARGIHILLAPGVNIYRSALCGRNFEYLGEDPFLSAQIVTPLIQGCQSQGVAATVKHFACNYQEYDRHGISSDVDERTLREVYLPAFEAAIKDAGSACVMTAYNLVNGQHASENTHLVMEILKGEWGFDGLVMSDWVSTYCEVGAANNGLDLEMPTARYLNREKLLPAIANGLVTEAVIDDKVRRLLRLMVCFGWLDRPQQDDSIPMEDPATWAVALEVARQGSVLLKNDAGFLPLDTGKLKRLAVIGGHAVNPVICGGGSAYTPPNHLVTILDGIRAEAGDGVEVVHAMGADPNRAENRFADSVYYTADGQRGLTGVWHTNREGAGEPARQAVDAQIDFQWHGLPPFEGFPIDCWRACWTGEIRPDTTGDHVFYLGVNEAAEFSLTVGDTEVIGAGDDDGGNIKQGLIHLEAGRTYPIKFIHRALRNWNAARLGWEPVAAIEAELQEAIDLAESADAVILCTGYTKETESEGFDRTFALPETQERLAAAIGAANPDTVLVLHAGGNVAMDAWLDKVRGLLQVWYPGQEGGQAVAELLFGKVNPSGKLAATYELREEDRSSHDCYHDADADKRVLLKDGIFGGYRHVDRHGVAPRFPFGYGLSYTTFAYENLGLSAGTLAADGELTVSFDLVNTGDRAGAEVAQVYVRDVESSLIRPLKELKGFVRAELAPGERRTVSVTLDATSLRFYDPAKPGWMVEPGAFEVLVGPNSAELPLTANFEVTG